MGEGSVEENQDWLLSDVEVQRRDSDWTDNERGPGERTEGWKLGLARRMKPEQRDKLGRLEKWHISSSGQKETNMQKAQPLNASSPCRNGVWNKTQILGLHCSFHYCAAQKMAVLPAITFSAHCRGPCNNLNGSNPANKSPVYQHYITKQIGRGKKKKKRKNIT